ncbi:hypothetical protein DFH06DRAFT_979249 [Mycena polygramma]|nr:hypothetical protein DFH06DRAFT_979249 [Mycena polygramma]
MVISSQRPHTVANTPQNQALVKPLIRSDAFQVLCAYQNRKSSAGRANSELTVCLDLLKRFFPRVHAHQHSQLELLWDRSALNPAFYDSAFTTAEFTFGNAVLKSRHDVDDVIHGVRAITILGTSCICVIPSDNLAIRCPPGSTIFIAGSIKKYFFSTVGVGEKRYFFQQYFNAGIQRWIDRGFRSDEDYDLNATPEEMAPVEAKMAQRLPFTYRLFSRLPEIHG